MREKVIQKSSEHSKQVGCTCTTVEYTSGKAYKFCQEICWCLNNIIEKVCIDPRDCHMMPDNVISPRKFFMKLPGYSYFVQNEIDVDIFLLEHPFR